MNRVSFWRRWLSLVNSSLTRRTDRLVSSLLCVETLEDRTLPSGVYAPHELLIQFQPGASDSARTEARGLVSGSVLQKVHTHSMAVAGKGVLERVSLPAAISPEEAAKKFQNNPNVKYAEPNWVVQPDSISNDAYYTNGSLWGMYSDDAPSAVGPNGTTNQFGSQAEEAWNAGYVGSNSVYVGIIDEGFQYSHPDLVDNSWTNPWETADGIDNDGNGYIDDIHGWDFYYNDNSTYDGTADDHGTHVAGTIGGKGGNGLGVAGVNWNVTMISTKFLGPSGGYTSGAIQALDYLTDLKIRHGINIVATNNSWGGGGFSQGLLDAINRAANQGILFVAAAGNSGSNNDTTANYPSNYSTVAGAGYEAVLAVAAIDSVGNKASFSSYGATTVDLGAPGVGIYSSVPADSYGSYSGTSMATPHVTGAAALYAAANPGATASQIRAAILNSTTPTASLNGITASGGRLNISALMQIQSGPSLSINDVSANEGNSGSTDVTFTVTLSASSSQTVTVDFATANGTASAGSDYVATSGTLTFDPGQTTKTITVTVNGDNAGELNESYFVNLSAAANATIADSQGKGTIQNDDAPVMTINDVSIAEGNNGRKQMRFTISLSAPAAATVTVRYATANGSATAPSDYKAASGTATISAGGSSTTVSVQINGDRTSESNETLSLNLTNAVNATLADNQGIGTIVNDDGGAAGGANAVNYSLLYATLSAELDAVIAEVNTLNLNRGEKNGVTVKLQAAQDSLGRANARAAVHQLQASIHLIAAMKRSGRLNSDLGYSLIEELETIKSSLLS